MCLLMAKKMAKKLAYQNHLKNADDLITSKEKTRAGFISLALEKSYLAIPYVEEAKALKTIASRAKSPIDLLKIKDLQLSLLTASGISDKAMNYLNNNDKTEAIKGLIENFLEPVGSDFVNELVYRYLLIKGDSLGGKARNLAGTLGERKFIRCLLSVLNVYKINCQWLDNENYQWKDKPKNDNNLEKRIKGLYWVKSKKKRLLLMNVNVPIVSKNVDLCLFDGEPTEIILKGKTQNSIHRLPERYIGLGELKGGIDPAGADEHWKTANSALNRIRVSFTKNQVSPTTFFVGAAIENNMAKEIFKQLEKGTLTNAGNLTENEQITSVCDWLIKL